MNYDPRPEPSRKVMERTRDVCLVAVREAIERDDHRAAKQLARISVATGRRLLDLDAKAATESAA